MKQIKNTINKWYGLHMDGTGNATLKPGELSEMKNFKISKGYNLQKRSGYKSLLNTINEDVPATNLIQGPYFENDAENYSFTGLDHYTADQFLFLNVQEVMSAHVFTQTVPVSDIVAGHKYYVRISASSMNNGAGFYVLLKNKKSNGTYETVQSSTTYLPRSQSVILNVTSVHASKDMVFEVHVMNFWRDGDDVYTGHNEPIVFEKPMILDLTDIYGPAFEPASAEIVDSDFALWFYGSTTVNLSIDAPTGSPIQGQWHGTLNGKKYHLFASGGIIYAKDKSLSANPYNNIGTMEESETKFFQFEDTQGIEQRQAGTAHNFGDVLANTKVGQSFTPERDAYITSVSLAIRSKTVGTTDNISCSIYVIDGASYNLLATSSNLVNGSALTTTYPFFTPCSFYFDGALISQEYSYLIAIERDGGLSGTNYYEVAYSSSSQISGGTGYISNGTWSTLTGDFWFTVSVKPQYSVYMMDGTNYKKWTGFGNIQDVDGYVPIVMTSTTPAGVGTLLEGVNMLTNKRRQFFNGDGVSTAFHLCETGLNDIKRIYINGVGAGTYTKDLDKGIATLSVAAPNGINNVEVEWESGSMVSADLLPKTGVELYGGKNDNRVFLYGNDAVIYYSGLANGVASAEYFPALNFIRVGNDETSVMDLAKHFDRLIIFKENSTYWSEYIYDTSLGVQFPIYPLNDTIGCSVKDGVQIINNNPFTIHDNKIYQLVASNVRDERNMVYMSEYIQPLLDGLDKKRAIITFDNQIDKEYWVVQDFVYIYNYDLKVWYVYELGDTPKSIIATDKVTFGDASGQMYEFDGSLTDNKRMIQSMAATGNMDYGTIEYRKMITDLWVSLGGEGYDENFADIYYVLDYTLGTETYVGAVGIASYEIGFEAHNIATFRRKLKAKRFAHIKFVFVNNLNIGCTIVSMSIPASISTQTNNMYTLE